QPADLSAIYLAEQLVGVYARRRQVVGIHVPDFGHVGAVLWVGEVSTAGELVALLAVLSASLAVGLPGDGGVAAMLSADAARGQHHVDGAQHVLHAVRVMLDAAGVHQKTGGCRAPPLGRLADGALGD